MDRADYLLSRRWYVCWNWWLFNSLITTPGILLMRLYALYSLNKKLLASLLVCFMTSLGVSGYIMAIIHSKVRSTSCRRTLFKNILNSDSGGVAFATRWNDLLSNKPHSDILHVLDTVDCFRVLALWTCRGSKVCRLWGIVGQSVASCSPFLSGILLSISLGERTSSFFKKKICFVR